MRSDPDKEETEAPQAHKSKKGVDKPQKKTINKNRKHDGVSWLGQSEDSVNHHEIKHIEGKSKDSTGGNRGNRRKVKKENLTDEIAVGAAKIKRNGCTGGLLRQVVRIELDKFVNLDGCIDLGEQNEQNLGAKYQHSIYNNTLNAPKNTNFLTKRSATEAGIPKIELDSKTKKVKFRPNLDQIPKYLFISSGTGKLKQWDLEEQRLMKDYGRMHTIFIYSIATTNDNRYLFTSDQHGFLKQWDLKKNELVKNYKRIHSGAIFSITITNNNQYLFTSGGCGELQQWDIERQKLLKDYGKIHRNSGIYAMTTTDDNKYLFTSSNKGELKQWDIEERRLLKDYTKKNVSIIFWSMVATKDSQNLFTAYHFGYLCQWNIKNQKLMKDYGKVHSFSITSMMITNDNQYLLTSTKKGELKQWLIKIKKITFIKKYMIVHSDNTTPMAISNDNQTLYTGDASGQLRLWDMQQGKLKNDYEDEDDPNCPSNDDFLESIFTKKFYQTGFDIFGQTNSSNPIVSITT